MVQYKTCKISDSWWLIQSGAFGLITAEAPNALTTLTEVFDNGLGLSRDKRFLGHRSVLSTKPLKYGPYVWQTYAQVDIRRRNIGSALTQLFEKGELGGGELETVGLWSQNRPGMLSEGVWTVTDMT